MAVDMFIKIDDVKGESQDAKYKEWIDILAWSWGLSQEGTFHRGGGGGTGKAQMTDLSVTKWVDRASPNLMKYCANGKQYKEAKLVVRKAGGKEPLEYLVINLKDVIVTSYNTGGGGGEERLTENINLNFAQVSIDYQQQKADGSKEGGPVKFGWNIAQNKEV